jgi:hypothetical protein
MAKGKAIGQTEKLLIGTAILSIGAWWWYTQVLGIQVRLPFMGYGQLGAQPFPMRIVTHDGRSREFTRAELTCLRAKHPGGFRG